MTRPMTCRNFAGLILVALLAGTARGEAWGSFSHLIAECDFIAQFQVHTREGKPIGRRLVQVYWQAEGFDEKKFYWQTKGFEDVKAGIVQGEFRPVTRTWNLNDERMNRLKGKTAAPGDFNRQTDGVITEFEFFGRGQHLWTASADKGVIFYPGSTAEPGMEVEIAGSDVEFHETLLAAARLKRAGTKIEGNLELSIFGKKQLAK
jgi:hypothetical protein